MDGAVVDIARVHCFGSHSARSPMENSLPATDSVSANLATSTIDPAAPSIVPELPGLKLSDSIIAAEPRDLPARCPPQRPIARRITERLILGVAALALYGAWIWIPDGAHRTTPALRGRIGSPEEIAPKSTAAITAPEPKAMPDWFSPQLLYMPTWTPPPSVPLRTEVPLPMPRPTRP
jgi:hypothetical protein